MAWIARCFPSQGRPHAHPGGTAQAGVPDGARGHGEAAERGQDRAPARARLLCGAGRCPALVTVPRERPRPSKENKNLPRAQNFPVNKTSQGAWWSLFERASRTHVTQACVTGHSWPSDCGFRRRTCPPPRRPSAALSDTGPDFHMGLGHLGLGLALLLVGRGLCGLHDTPPALRSRGSLWGAHLSSRGPCRPGRQAVRGTHQKRTGRRLCWTEQPGGPPGGGGVSMVTGES